MSILNNDEIIIKASQLPTTKDALKFLGLRAAGGNYKAFKEACIRVGVDQPIGKSGFYTAAKKNTIPLNEILIENSTYTNRGNLKKRCYQAGLLEERCYAEGCLVQSPIWNGKKITLQLEHINGIYNDNRIENLAILCPNCHSQTHTFAGKNHQKKKQVRVCADCGVQVWRNSVRCNFCESKKRIDTTDNHKIDWPNLEDLIKMVEDSSYVKVGEMLGVSDNAVRKHIKKRVKPRNRQRTPEGANLNFL